MFSGNHLVKHRFLLYPFGFLQGKKGAAIQLSNWLIPILLYVKEKNQNFSIKDAKHQLDLKIELCSASVISLTDDLVIWPQNALEKFKLQISSGLQFFLNVLFTFNIGGYPFCPNSLISY